MNHFNTKFIIMNNFKAIWFCLFVLIVFYIYGAAMLDGFQAYPLYYIAGKSDKWIEYKNMANKLQRHLFYGRLYAFPLFGSALLPYRK